LSQAEQLASLGQTMSGVAHELNNPLATILACAERLRAAARGTGPLRDLDAIPQRRRTRRAHRPQPADVCARNGTRPRTMVDLNQVVRETLGLRAYEQRVANVVIFEALAAACRRSFADRTRFSRSCSTSSSTPSRRMLTRTAAAR
jgi:C4-dicarboxylate-specific signal transduction histidine kinase